MYEFEELIKIISFAHSYFIFLLIINRIVPLIVANHNWVLKSGLVRITIFFWFTPLPRIILILNLIEDNEWIDEILDNQDTIINNQKIIIKEIREKPDLLNKLFVKLKEDKKQNKSNNTIWQ